MTPWLSCTTPSPTAALRLFCFPYAGGGGTWIYRNWGRALPSFVEVYSIELPGHGRRLTETPIAQLDVLIASLAKAMRPYLDKPFACFGHSLGGLLAFELIKYLQQNAQLYPVHLWVSATRAPHLPTPKPLTHTLPDKEFIAEIQRYNGIPSKILSNPEFMQLLLPALRADFTMLETYRYSQYPPLSCPITAFWGEDDKTIEQTEIAAWSQHTSNVFSLQGFLGDHFFIHQPQVVSVLDSSFSKLPSLT